MGCGLPVYEFGEFRLDVGEKQLRRAGGEVVAIPPKAFDLLVFLVENPGRLLEKDALMNGVWAENFVEEGNLKLHIHTLRKVFEKNGTSYIETVPRRGYRFNAEVRDLRKGDLVVEKITESHLVIDQTISHSIHPLRRYLTPALLLAGVIAVGFGVYVSVFRRNADAAGIAPANAQRSIAVLPFRNITRDDRDGFLSVGLADNLIQRLSTVRGFVVRPTSAVLKLDDSNEDSVKRLNVDNLIEGSIQRVDDRLRITVQLVATSDKRLIWAKSYDRSGTDLLTIQDAIAADIAGTVAMDRGTDPGDITIKRETSDPIAYELYLKGRYFLNKRNISDMTRAADYFTQATRSDPNFCLAYVGIADSYQLLAEYGGMDAAEALEKARAAGGRALNLNEASAEAHTSIAYTLAFYDWNWPGAEKEFRRAIELDPNYPTARQWYSEYLVAYGRFDEAMEELKKAEQIDPTSPIIQTDIAAIYYLTRQYDRSISQTTKILELDPSFAYAYAYQWISFEQLGQLDNAADSLIKLDSLFAPPEMVTAERNALAGDGWKGLWSFKYGFNDRPPFDKLWSDYVRAMAMMRLGDTEGTFRFLTRSSEKRERWFVNLDSDPQWDPIRTDPRFVELVAKLGR